MMARTNSMGEVLRRAEFYDEKQTVNFAVVLSRRPKARIGAWMTEFAVHLEHLEDGVKPFLFSGYYTGSLADAELAFRERVSQEARDFYDHVPVGGGTEKYRVGDDQADIDTEPVSEPVAGDTTKGGTVDHMTPRERQDCRDAGRI